MEYQTTLAEAQGFAESLQLIKEVQSACIFAASFVMRPP